MGPLWLSLLPKQFYELEIYSLYILFLLLQQCLERLCARAFLKDTCIAKIVSLSKNQLNSRYPTLRWN